MILSNIHIVILLLSVTTGDGFLPKNILEIVTFKVPRFHFFKGDLGNKNSPSEGRLMGM